MFVGGQRPGLGLYIRFHPFHLQHPVASVGDRNRLSGLPLESAIVLSEGLLITDQVQAGSRAQGMLLFVKGGDADSRA